MAEPASPSTLYSGAMLSRTFGPFITRVGFAAVHLVAACTSAQSAPSTDRAAPSNAPRTVATPALPSIATPPALPRSAGASTPAHAAPRGATLTIATWNLEWLAAGNGEGPVPRDDAAFARLRKYAQRLNADVIAVQEVASVAALARVFDPARYAFYVTADSSPQRTGFVYDKRLQVQVYPDYTPLRTGNLRSGADLGLNWNGKSVRLLSVHLKSGCFAKALGQDDACAKLKAQVPKLEAWLDARAHERTPFAVLGDFNRRLFAASNDAVWRALDDSEPPESDLSAPTQGEHSRCWNGRHPTFVDHIVLSRTLNESLQPGSFVQQLYEATDAPYRKQLSDHCPIALRLSQTLTSSAPSDVSVTTAGSASVPPVPSGAPSSYTPPSTSVSATPPPLPVKGNRSRKGERYYHTPACPHYAQVKVEPAKGEQLFPDETAARAAGYRRSPDCPK